MLQLQVTCHLYSRSWSSEMPTDTCYLQGQAYSDPGATAYDAVDGAITDITVTGVSAVDTMVVGFLMHALHKPGGQPTTPNSAVETFQRKAVRQ